MSDLVCVMTFPNRLEAEYAQGILESEGIRSMIQADDCGSLRPDMLLLTEGVRLFVLKDQAERAAEILREAETPEETE